MRQKTASRPATNRNGSPKSNTNSILPDRKLKNKIHVAFLRGSVLGAVLAIFVGILHMDTSILEGLIIAGTGCAWLGIFYFINSDDEIFGGVL